MKHVLNDLMLLSVALSAALGLPSTTCAAEPAKDRCVILVSVDGLAGFYLDDPKADMPTLRLLAREGARAQSMLASFPTVTWPNHTTLVTGVTPAKHGVLGNALLDRRTGEKVPLIPDPLFDKDQIVKAPTVYDAVFEAGLKTAAICWPATRNARTLHWTVPDMFDITAWETYGTKSWLAELRSEGWPVDMQGKWVKEQAGGVQRDWLYTRMGRQLLEKHPPNLLLIHLVEADHIQHRYGPRTPEAYWSVSYEDDRLRDLHDAILNSPRKDNTTLIVCSDHGFFPIETDIRPNVLLKTLGLLKQQGTTAADKQAYCLPEGGGCSVYILNTERRDEIRTQLLAEFAKVEGVEAVLPSSDERIGQATPEQHPQAPDLWLAAKSGYSFTDSIDGDKSVVPRPTKGGTHGYLPEHADMHATFVVWGAGIKKGARLSVIDNRDVAPTIAHLLGIELPSADGKVLREALAP